MTIETKISLNMTTNQAPVVVDVVQGEQMTRVVSATLYDGAQTWSIPGDVKVGVAFRKPDGTGGLYDELPNKKPAVTVSGSTVKATLAPQVQSVAGDVAAAIVFMVPSTMERLATFPFILRVAKDPSTGSPASNNYYKYSTLEEINNAITGLGDDVASIIDDNAINSKSAWSSKQIIDTLCPPFDITGSTVTCSPILGYPLAVISGFNPIQAGSDVPSPNNIRDITAPTQLTLTQSAGGQVKTYTAQLPHNVYKGFVDWAEPQKSRTTHAFAEIDGNAGWILDGGRFRAKSVLPAPAKNGDKTGFTNYAPYNPGFLSAGIFAYNSDIYVGSELSKTMTLEEWKSKLNSHKLQIVYRTNISAILSVTPSGAPEALPGENTFATDAGDTTVSGREYPYTKIARQQAEIDDLRKAIISTGGNV